MPSPVSEALPSRLGAAGLFCCAVCLFLLGVLVTLMGIALSAVGFSSLHTQPAASSQHPAGAGFSVTILLQVLGPLLLTVGIGLFCSAIWMCVLVRKHTHPLLEEEQYEEGCVADSYGEHTVLPEDNMYGMDDRNIIVDPSQYGPIVKH